MSKFYELCLTLLLFRATIRCTEITLENDLGLDKDHVIIHTNSGPLEGTVAKDFEDREVSVYYGIPYAEAPVGELRFKPPQPVKPWSDVLKATKKPLPCYQQAVKEFQKANNARNRFARRPWSENCLSLNIWTPKSKSGKLPVIVVFHSRLFLNGNNNYPDGGTLSSSSDTIVVSVNFRLGPFGFLNLGVPEAPGNVGLLDQQLALKWVHENIHHFGGMNKAIMLLGHGAGAASVGYHLLSPGSDNYYVTAAAFGGSPTCFWAFQDRDKSLENARTLAKRLNCQADSIEEELECLRNVHPEDLLDADEHRFNMTNLHFLPTVDGTFISEPPVEALRAGHFKKRALLSVSTVKEGSLVFAALNTDLMPDPEKGLDRHSFRTAVRRIRPDLNEAQLYAVEVFYIGGCHSDPVFNREAGIQVYSDLIMSCCMLKLNDYFSDHGGIVFSAVTDAGKHSNPSWIGSAHSIILDYLFGYALIEDGFSEAEANLSRYSMDWINYQTRHKAEEMARELRPYNSETKSYTYWDLNGPRYFNSYRADHCKFWEEIIPKLGKSQSTCNHH